MPVTFTDASLTKQLALTLKDVCGQAQVSQPVLITGAEDFSFFQEQIPGFFFIGGCPAAPWGTAISRLAVDYLHSGAG